MKITNNSLPWSLALLGLVGALFLPSVAFCQTPCTLTPPPNNRGQSPIYWAI
jgi:hypothetical protein